MSFDLNEEKLKLTNVVCGSLFAEPRFNQAGDPRAQWIATLVSRVAERDPEFILKVALYVRDDLNVRSTANFLLALAANIPECGPFMKKYFHKAVRLPSDWLDVAALYHLLPDRRLKGNALPTALRKAMIAKFAQFDAYQLAKYNKQNSLKRKRKKALALAEKAKAEGTRPPRIPEKQLTIKQLVRQLHISQPAPHVMCILGKKYPMDMISFRDSGLAGEFDPTRAGVRMKLAVPETWETMISAQGNKACVWEELIDKRKLPFMAMLRNLRNLLLTGISNRHHNWVKSRLRDERTIANSRQFPFSFFTAYEAIDINLEELRTSLEAAAQPQPAKSAPTRGGRAAGRGGKAPVDGQQRRARKVIVPVNMPTQKLIEEYKDALDTAVKYATVHNVKPIRGSTLVLLNASAAMRTGTLTGRSVGRVNSLFEVGVLLGLMCKYMCEDCDFRLVGTSHAPVQLKEGTILDNMAVVAAMPSVGDSFQFPYNHLEGLIQTGQKLDNIILLTDETVAPGHAELVGPGAASGGMSGILKKYRQLINPDLLYVNVNLPGAKRVVAEDSDEGTSHPNDILVSGFSDAILKFVAERGDGDQIEYIQHIDEAKSLDALTAKLANRVKGFKIDSGSSTFWSFTDNVQTCKWEGCGYQTKAELIGRHMAECGYRLVSCEVETCPEIFPANQAAVHAARCFYQKMAAGEVKKWRSVRVFVSSTFLDMHGERDVLTRFVFPELKAYCAAKRIHFFYVDLRWGITEEDFRSGRILDVCLNEVERCKPFFLGLLGDRYGWVPDSLTSADPRFTWLADHQGKSITELEILSGALSFESRDRGASVFIRDSSFTRQVPAEHRTAFECSAEHLPLLEDLKDRVRAGTRSYSYSASWGGEVDGKPVAKNLQRFQEMVTAQLRGDIDRMFPDAGAPRDELDVERDLHEAYVEAHSRRFIGREDEMKELFAFADDKSASAPPLVIHGHPGFGKSALAARFCRAYGEARPGAFLLPHFLSASPRASDSRYALWRLCAELKKEYAIKAEVPETFKELKQVLPRFLEQAAFGRPCVIVMDSLQLLKGDGSGALAWLPVTLPVKLIVTMYTNTAPYNALRYRDVEPQFIEVGEFNEAARKELVRLLLSEYRKKLEESPTNNQMRNLIRKSGSAKPLWLVKACEELCLFGVYEKLSDEIRRLPASVSGLLGYILTRLEADYGKQLVTDCLGLLSTARAGLTEAELLSLLELPQARWAALSRGLESFLSLVGHGDAAVLSFAHDAITAAVHKRYLKAKDSALAYHASLAAYFRNAADPAGDGSWTTTDRRAISELPYHLQGAGKTAELEAVLADFGFLSCKVNMGMTYELAADLHAATTTSAPVSASFFAFGDEEDEAVLSPLEDCLRFVSSNSYLLTHNPALLHQQAANQPDSSLIAAAAQLQQPDHAWISWRNKPQHHDACKLTVAGSAEAMLACAFAPDGKAMVCASRDRSLKIFDVASGSEKASLHGHTSWVVDCTYSHDGSMIASASWDNTVRLWDAYAGSQMKCLKEHNKRVAACCFSADDAWLLSGSWDCTMRMWATRGSSSSRPKEFRGHNKPISAVCFAPDGKRVASASWDCTVRVWDVDTTKCLAVLSGHTASVRSVAFAPNGRQLVSTSSDCSIRVWDLDSQREVGNFSGHAKPVNSCTYSADGRQLITASDDQTIKVWDAQGGSQVRKMRLQDECHGNAVAFSPDHKLLATANSDCTVTLWNVLSGAVLATFSGHTRSVNSVAFSPDASLLASTSEDKKLMLYDAVGHTVLREIVHPEGVHYAAFHPSQLKVLVGVDDGTMYEWDLEDTTLPARQYTGHTSAVLCCSYAPNKARIASASKDGTIRVWNSEDGAMKQVIRGHMDWVTACHFSPDGKKLVSASWDFNAFVWDAKSGKKLHELRGHTGALTDCCWAPDSLTVATTSFDSTVKVWSAINGQPTTTIEGHTQSVNGCAWDNTHIASCGDDGTVRIWDAEAGMELATLQGHSGTVKSIGLSADKAHIVSASEDCTVKVWDAKGADEADDSAAAHRDTVTDCAFSPDGALFMSASRDGSFQVWDSAACQVLEQINVGGKDTTAVSACAMSTQYAYAGLEDGYVVSWDVSKKSLAKSFKAHSKPVTCVRAAGGVVVTGSWDGTLAVWGEQGGKVRSLNGHTDWVNDCALNPSDASMVLSASHDHSVRVWNGTRSSTLGSHENWVLACGWSANGNKAVSGGYDATLKVWDVNSQQCTAAYTDCHLKQVNRCAFSADGRAVISTSHDRSVVVYDCRSQEMVSTFHLKGYGSALAIHGDYLNIGDSLGNVYFTQLMN